MTRLPRSLFLFIRPSHRRKRPRTLRRPALSLSLCRAICEMESIYSKFLFWIPLLRDLQHIRPRRRSGNSGVDQANMRISLWEIAPHAHVGSFVVLGQKSEPGEDGMHAVHDCLGLRSLSGVG